jgi:hypothetical protein
MVPSTLSGGKSFPAHGSNAKVVGADDSQKGMSLFSKSHVSHFR